MIYMAKGIFSYNTKASMFSKRIIYRPDYTFPSHYGYRILVGAGLPGQGTVFGLSSALAPVL